MIDPPELPQVHLLRRCRGEGRDAPLVSFDPWQGAKKDMRMEGGGGPGHTRREGVIFLAPPFPSCQVMLCSVLFASSRKHTLIGPPGLSGFPGTGRPHLCSSWPRLRTALPSGAGALLPGLACGLPYPERPLPPDEGSEV